MQYLINNNRIIFIQIGAAMIADAKTKMLNAMDEYISATQSVYEWAGTAIPLLTKYIEQFGKGAEKNLLAKMLDDGVQQMRNAQNQIGGASVSLNEVAGSSIDHGTAGSEIFQKIDNMKGTFHTGIQHIADLVVRNENTIAYIGLEDIPELRDTIIESAKNLIAKCEEYRKRHAN